MKVLLSAFACIPGVGSEGGVGWFWAHEWAKDHEVVVITDITRRAAIDAELRRHPTANPRFVFFRPWWLKHVPLNSATAQLLFQLWQFGLVGFVRRLNKLERFDLAHHVTYGVFRQPSFLGRTGLPLVFGPVGGGEDAPWRLKRRMTHRDRMKEVARTALNRWARVDPLLRSGLQGCSLILAKTSATARALPPGFEQRVKVMLEIGTIARSGVEAKSAPAGRACRLLYAGHHVSLKGMHLGIAAFAQAVRSGAEVQLTMVGDGPSAEHLRSLASRLAVADKVTWVSRLPQAELFDVYRRHDVLLFPSLHDSSGNVVVEALSFAMPVVCLDLGGPGEIVDDRCGCVIRTGNLGEQGVVASMAEAICALATDDALFERKSTGALERAAELDWHTQARRIKLLALRCVDSPDATVGEQNQPRESR